MKTLEQIFGPNWRTTLSGLGTTALVILIALNKLPADVWKDPKVWFPAVLGIILKTIGDFQAKDRQVCGNGTADDPHRVADKEHDASRILPLLLVAGLASLTLSGCAGYDHFAATTERTYQLGAGETADGDRSANVSITLRPALGFAK